MSNFGLSQITRQRFEQQTRALDAFLGRSAAIAAIIAPQPSSGQFLTRIDTQRLYHFIGRSEGGGARPSLGEKRRAALHREAMVRRYPGLRASFLLMGQAGFQDAQGLWVPPAQWTADVDETAGKTLDFQCELTASEAREVADYLRWLGSVRPAFDWLDEREVSARPITTAAMPRMRRFVPLSSSAEMHQHACEALKEARRSVWLTAPTVRNKGFIQELGDVARTKSLAIRCLIGDVEAAKALAVTQPEWEVLACPEMACSSLLIDAAEEATALVSNIPWAGATVENALGLCLALSVDDTRLRLVKDLWAEITPHCVRASQR
jgi:hypothetical protein